MTRKLLILLLLMPLFALGKSNIERPLIGISCGEDNGSSKVKATYTDAIWKAGGTPVVIPMTADSLALREVLRNLDGVVLSGGGDVDPKYYGEAPHENLGTVNPLRDTYDLLLARMAHDMNIPMLGICRGMQLLNVAFGGSLYQDIPTQCPAWSLQHRARIKGEKVRHLVNIEADSQIAKMFGTTSLETNSSHHQAVKVVAPGFRIVAWATDSTPEAMESTEEYPIWGVQFHPESMATQGDEVALRLFESFVGKARTFRHAKAIHRRIISIDTHTDAPIAFKDDYNFGDRTNKQVNIPKMEEGFIDCQYLACWVKQGPCTAEGTKSAVDKGNRLIDNTLRQIAQNSDHIELARTPEDIARIKSEGKRVALLSIENAYGVGGSIADFERIHKLGVTAVTICHSLNNDYCDSSSDKTKRWNGLSPLGREAVREMNRLGIIIDISHASEETFWDVLKESKKPVIASHSSSHAITDHNRNLTDKQLRGLAKCGGVAQVCLVERFVATPDAEGPRRGYGKLSHFIEHLLHIIKVAGIDHAGIGTDFDGGGGVAGCQGNNDLINITVRLLEEGFSESDIAKIWGGNFLRVMSEVQRR